ncbi:MAG: NAD-binding protein [Geobacteraceae bacterium]|nr:NAD-binding protein [Geobacteraceae bacterium]
MKSIASELAYFVRGHARQNLKVLLLYFVFLIVMTLAYAVIFRYLMWHTEGREFSFIAGLYWTITVMTTLGFGDITFHTDAGYIFAAIVTISGVVFLLIILPFTMISLFLAPWIEERLRYTPTLELPPDTRGHIVIFGLDSITRLFIKKLEGRNLDFVVVTRDYDRALKLEEQEGLKVVYGSATDVNVMRRLRVEAARYVVANLSDPQNANICLTLRSLCNTPVVALIRDPDHQKLLRQAGANHVIAMPRIVGRFLATRATTRGAMAHVLDTFGALHIAEFPVNGTPFAGMTLEKAQIRQKTGLSVIGLWKRGHLTIPNRDTILDDESLALLAGNSDQLKGLEKLIGNPESSDLVFVLGHGRIGCAAATFLERKPVPFVLIDQSESTVCSKHVPVIGDATSRSTLTDAGIENATGVIVTTNDDSTNVFLTLASRYMHPNIRIVARANEDENVDQLYAAGADFVAAALTGKKIIDSELRHSLGCSIIALKYPDGHMDTSPQPDTVLEHGINMLLIGSVEQEKAFDARYPRAAKKKK